MPAPLEGFGKRPAGSGRSRGGAPAGFGSGIPS